MGIACVVGGDFNRMAVGGRGGFGAREASARHFLEECEHGSVKGFAPYTGEVPVGVGGRNGAGIIHHTGGQPREIKNTPVHESDV